jgi:hypothetical protein
MNGRSRLSLGLLMKGSWKLGAAIAGAGNSEMRGKLRGERVGLSSLVVVPDMYYRVAIDFTVYFVNLIY